MKEEPIKESELDFKAEYLKIADELIKRNIKIMELEKAVKCLSEALSLLTK